MRWAGATCRPSLARSLARRFTSPLLSSPPHLLLLILLLGTQPGCTVSYRLTRALDACVGHGTRRRQECCPLGAPADGPRKPDLWVRLPGFQGETAGEQRNFLAALRSPSTSHSRVTV